jgi:formate dehydrogenase major subunit
LDAFSGSPPAAAAAEGRRELDFSSPVFLVDHSACILCDRCVRACDEVKENHIIGRTGKGANAGIGFDLNDEMGKSDVSSAANAWSLAPRARSPSSPWQE